MGEKVALRSRYLPSYLATRSCIMTVASSLLPPQRIARYPPNTYRCRSLPTLAVCADPYIASYLFCALLGTPLKYRSRQYTQLLWQPCTSSTRSSIGSLHDLLRVPPYPLHA